MKKLLFAFAIAIAISLPCWARIGETEIQSIDRYGQPINTFHTAVKEAVRHDYWKDGFLVKAIFFHGVCCSISFEKATYYDESSDQSYKDEGLILSETEKKLLLDQNSQGHLWTKSPDDGKGDVWSRNDGGAALVVGTILSIDSPEFETLAKLEEQANQKFETKTAKKSVGGL